MVVFVTAIGESIVSLCYTSCINITHSYFTYQVSVFRKAANPTKEKVMINKKLYNDDKNGGDSGCCWGCIDLAGCFDVVGTGPSIIQSLK